MKTQKELAIIIIDCLTKYKLELKDKFESSIQEVGVRYCYLDDLLPDSIANRICSVFPDKVNMRLMSSFRERKYTSKKFDQFDQILKNMTFAIQDAGVIRLIEEITGIVAQSPDPSLYAGGLSLMEKGNFLNPHIDNSHEMTRSMYRTLNLLYYVNKNWSFEKGGNLELWDKKVKRNVTIESQFNRLVIMETNPWSWHSVSPVTANENRMCVSNYYFSKISPIGREYFNVTSFSARPEQCFRRIVSGLDNGIRNMLRLIKPIGIGKKDIYVQNNNM
ncbi:2OG-Fe(II) oxygenase [Leptospira interrogans]|nr:2OG-Fe(II) oxygenase [Leptospira interrogans]KAA1288361.1 2OG-Fe(II) oxygenase [Leptospira interrogans serovar Geyaweera]MCD1166884.1 2OG-Fe(II) oxygenase [Leptospira interrogans]MCH1886066.1 2OG-Fe(II) oxygenase [Leptospira interrogans]MCH1892305.1 2OG-Fe(II) oxygenase [Leptospira interrogans]MCH1899141.1 2OG-Fe(II) oxygenase [Leptospira interrogans]